MCLKKRGRYREGREQKRERERWRVREKMEMWRERERERTWRGGELELTWESERGRCEFKGFQIDIFANQSTVCQTPTHSQIPYLLSLC